MTNRTLEAGQDGYEVARDAYGRPWYLKMLASPSVGVSQEGSAFIWRHPEFNKVTTAAEVRQRAVVLLDVLSAIGRREDGDLQPVGVFTSCRRHSYHVDFEK